MLPFYVSEQVWENLSTPLERASLNIISKIAKFEGDLWKTYEGIVPQSRDISQTFVWWGAQTCLTPATMQMSVNFGNFAERYFRLSKMFHCQTWPWTEE